MTRSRGRLRPSTIDVAETAQAAILLPLLAAALHRWGLRRVIDALARLPARTSPTVQPDVALNRARRAVARAAAHSFRRANCLERSLALWFMLRRRGVAADLRIGVRRRPGRKSGARALDFHAWIEHDGVVLNDVADVRARFACFDRPIAPREAQWRSGGLTAQ